MDNHQTQDLLRAIIGIETSLDGINETAEDILSALTRIASALERLYD